MRNEEHNDGEFDATLARALERVNAPEDFAAQVQAKAKAGQTQNIQRKAKVFAFPKPPVWLSGALAAMLVMGVVAAERMHVDHQREEGQQIAATQREFNEGVRAANHALDQTREQLAKAGLNLGE